MRLSPEDKAMLITFTGASIFVLVFFFLSVKPYDSSQIEEFIPIPIIEELPVETEELQEPEEVEQLNQKMTNQAQSSNRLVREANRFFSQQNQVDNALKTDSQTADPSEDNDGDDEAFPDYQQRIALLKQRRKEKQSAGESTTSKQVSKVNTSSYRRSTVSYNLNERNAIKIPNPVYTCDATGKVVINIEVSNLGSVTRAYYNKAASTTTNGCLLDQALEYAQQALFNDSKRTSQLGTITFEFQG